MKIFLLISSLSLIFMCGTSNHEPFIHPNADTIKNELDFDSDFIARKFRNPVGNPQGIGYYDANPFMNKTHLGEDWNGNGGGNTDLGDTVYAAANGYVNFADNIHGGWGNVIRILHQLPHGNKYTQVESLYAHFSKIFVKPDTYIKLGSPIGTIGTADGIYPAHLHFEMRHDVSLDIGGGYNSDTAGYLNPKQFIQEFNKNN